MSFALTPNCPPTAAISLNSLVVTGDNFESVINEFAIWSNAFSTFFTSGPIFNVFFTATNDSSNLDAVAAAIVIPPATAPNAAPDADIIPLRVFDTAAVDCCILAASLLIC